MALWCAHCKRWADDERDLAMHVGHFCRRAPSGAVARAREEIEIPQGLTRYRIPQDDPAYKLGG